MSWLTRKARPHARSSLCSAGISVLRFWNNDVDRNLEGVLTRIDDALNEPHPAACDGHPPPSREG
ncbi:MAG: DUF559 domain-containing protein [Xanthobacteraceae bacterium]